MTAQKKCFRCLPKASDTTSSGAFVKEPEPTYDAVKRIWRHKMEKSKLFFPLEGNHIIPIWIKFIRNMFKFLPEADAEEFYVETAQIAAQKFKHFYDDGWRCLDTEYPFELTTCSEESIQIQRQSSELQEGSTSEITTTPSAESISDSLLQVEFLIQLVASSNFSLNLTKTALNPEFQPTHIELKYPQVFVLPNKYLELNLDEIPKDKLRKDLLFGEYDEYILPLQIANEVDDKFWTQIESHDS